MKDDGLDEIEGIYFITNFNEINKSIITAQDNYIRNRLRWIWKLPLFSTLAAKKITFMHSKAETHLNADFSASYTQKVMVVGKSMLWSLLILKWR